MFRTFAFVFLFSALNVAAQQTPHRKTIDSLSRQQWDSAGVDLDSLADLKLVRIPYKPADTIMIRKAVIVPDASESVPITPYMLMKSEVEKRWFFFGQNSLLFNQSAFSNWYAGGNNNFGVLGKVNYNIAYKNRRHFLDNNIQMGYGLVSSTGQSPRKTDDYINILTNYGYDLGRDVYLSTGYQFRTQFQPGYDYALTPNPVYEDRISRFMAPGYLNVGIGLSYNPSENFQVIFRPATGKFTFVLDEKLQKKGRFGLERDGQSVRTEIGAMANILYKVKIMDNMSYTNQLTLFSNYANHPERVDIMYNGVLDIKFNKFISTIVTIDLMYDHDQMQALQLKQTLGVGFSYDLGFQLKERPDKKKLIKPFL